jgi:hypothetical protein
MTQETANQETGNRSPSLRVSNSKLRFHPGSSASFPGSIKFAVSFVRPRCAVVLAACLWCSGSRQQSLVLSCLEDPVGELFRSLRPSPPSLVCVSFP